MNNSLLIEINNITHITVTTGKLSEPGSVVVVSGNNTYIPNRVQSKNKEYNVGTKRVKVVNNEIHTSRKLNNLNIVFGKKK